jgi:hypothetical protein
LDPDTVSFRRTAIPFMGCSVRDEAGSFPVVIPELRWEAPHPGSGAWVYWKLSVREPGAACSGPYSLILEGGGIDLETFQERGKPWI